MAYIARRPADATPDVQDAQRGGGGGGGGSGIRREGCRGEQQVDEIELGGFLGVG